MTSPSHAEDLNSYQLKANTAAGGDIPLYGDGSYRDDFVTQGIPASALTNVTGMANPITLTSPDARSERQQQFYEAWDDHGRSPETSSQTAVVASAYDITSALANAANQVGSDDVDKIKAFMESPEGDVTWALGVPISYSEDSHFFAEGSWRAFPLSSVYHADEGYFDVEAAS